MPLLPLVEPARSLPRAEAERAARQRRLPEVGELGQRRLANARIAVLGAGGLGSPVLQYLASAGVGTLGIIDFDTVEASNLQRQVLFGVQDVGRLKAEVAAERVTALSPHTRVVQHLVPLTPENATDLLSGYDLVVDGTDTFETRYAAADACDGLGIPLVWGSVLRFDAQATVFWSRPTSGEPVSLRDLFPSPPPPGQVPSCAEAGVVGAACGQLGSILAMEAVKLVCGIGRPLLGRMLVIDALAATTREVPLSPGTGPTRNATISLEDALGLEATLLDVRNPDETERGTLPGAVTLPLPRIVEAPDAAFAGLREPIVVYCRQGPRARAAASALVAARPDADVRVLTGGYADHVEHLRQGAP
jgi:molybdopterin/thiamine biosynthesis adenylyltransferase/rhodanese-related sulfurtransferase